MPNCFTLTLRGASTPRRLQEVDDHLREILNQPSDPENWLFGWYNIVGLSLACGQTFDQIVDTLEQQKEHALDNERQHYTELIAVTRVLDEHYVANSWYEHK